jgi:hypothetical protein
MSEDLDHEMDETISKHIKRNPDIDVMGEEYDGGEE